MKILKSQQTLNNILSTNRGQFTLQRLETQSNELPIEADPEPQPQQDTEYQKMMYPKHNHVAYMIRKYYCRFVQVRWVYCASLLICIFTSIIYYQLDYRKDSSKAQVILYFSFLNHVFAFSFCLLSIKSFNDWRRVQGNVLKTKSIFTWLFKCVVILLQPYPWMQDIYILNYNYSTQSQIPVKLNYLLSLLSLLKSWLIIYSSVYFLKAYKIRSSKIWKKYGPSDSYLFSVKCLFKQHSIFITLMLFAFCLGFFSFAYRVSERYRNEDGQNNLFEEYGNCVWIVFVTMTTVGYGDIYPATLWGRSFGFLCTFVGVLLVSIMVLVVINTFQMDNSEIQTLKILNRLKQKKQIRIAASQYMRLALWRVWTNKKLSRQGLSSLQKPESRKQRIKKNQLSELIRLSKFNDASEKSISIQMSRNFERVSFYIHNLVSNLDSMIDFMSQNNLMNLEQMQNKSHLFGATVPNMKFKEL